MQAMDLYLTAAGLGRCRGVAHLFGTRWVDSPGRAARFLGIPEDRAVTVRQVHGDRIFIVDSARTERGGASGKEDPGYDALLTREPGIFIAVATADCVPILIADRVQNVIAAVHAGWKGSLARIAEKVVRTMIGKFGCSADGLVAGIGPSAGPCCYEVDGAVLDPLKDEFPEWPSVVGEERGGRAKLDLRALNRLQLAAAGVPEDRIDIVDRCTICSPERFSSFRREGRAMRSMYSGIALKPA